MQLNSTVESRRRPRCVLGSRPTSVIVRIHRTGEAEWPMRVYGTTPRLREEGRNLVTEQSSFAADDLFKDLFADM